MAVIHVLDKHTAELIAAGEVVERPASVVKELLENSIDAGATQVTVSIESGGVKLIEISDNGTGIEAEYISTAFIRHATSKIETPDDLTNIHTLGFRGEALASIASVARVELTTRTEVDEFATVYRIEGGEEVSREPGARAVGTTIRVKDLFYNTPARMKFLKKDSSEGTFVSDTVTHVALSGVGKSTLLRAILFFYNADTQRLGISVEKQNYTDYYFPYSNSYIVYEVATENGAFCILSFKSMNRVCYRFIHSPYRKEFFIDENRVAYSESDRVRAVLDQYGIEYSRIIYTYDEYRNILYGNSTSPEFSRYSLMESKQYQNIPRTIQNVLLNSKLDAEFIKKTIISSLNEDETAIDLNSYKEHLKNFETRLKDIEEFQKRETRKQAREITLLSQQTSKLQGGLVQNCRELVAAFRKAESILPQWKEKQDRTDADKGKLIRRKQELQDESRKRSDKLQEALAVLNNELQKALGKEKDYQNKNIEEIIERSSKKEEWKNRQVGLLEEQRILTSQYMEISTKYKSLIQALDEQWNKIHEAKIKQLDTLNNAYNERLEEARKEYQRFTDSLYQEFESLSQQLHPLKAEKLGELNAIDYQIKLCRKEVFFEEEQQELKTRIQNYANFHT